MQLQGLAPPVFSSFETGQADATAGGALPSKVGISLIRLTAPVDNTLTAYFGPSGVDATTGVALSPGTSAFVPLNDLSKVYLAAEAGSGTCTVCWEVYR
jgi:hypothetical protein